MTVVQLNLSGAWGGMEMSTLKVANYLKGRGHRSLVITSRHAPLVKEAQALGVEVLEIDGEGHFSPRASWQLRKILKSYQVDIVMVHQLRNLWILRPALWGLKQIRVFGFARMFLKNIRKTGWIYQYLYGRIEKMIALNHSQMKSLLPCLPVPESRYVIVPNGVDLERFHPQHRDEAFRRKEFGAEEGTRVIGVVGRLDPQKGQLEFIEAAADLVREFNNVRFIVVGEETTGEPGYAQKLRKRAAELGLNHVVRFLGHREDIPKIMASLDVFVMPSYEEAFGNVILEAMASRQAVIATNAGGPPDIISSGQWGFLVAPRSSKDLTMAIRNYLSDAELAAEHAQKARKVAEEKYSLPQVMRQIESLM